MTRSISVASQGCRTQAQRREESGQRMIDAAFRLIGSGGMRALSLAAVGEAAGCSRELPRYHYGSKDAFIAALIDDCERAWGDQLRRPQEQGLVGAEALLSLFDSLHELLDQPQLNRGRLLLIFELAGDENRQLRQKINAVQAATRRHIERLLRAGMAAGKLAPDIDTAAIAALLNGAYRGIGYQWVMDPQSIDLEAVHEQLRKLFIQALVPHWPNTLRGLQ